MSPLLALLLAAAPQASMQEADRAVGPVTAIENVRILPVTAPPIESGTILIRGDRIAAVGADVAVPGGAQVVDGTGLTAVPGFIDTFTGLGLIEVAGVPASNDSQEPGAVHPELRAADAYFLDSELLPLVRAAGTLVVLSAPGTGNVISGRSALMRTAGTTLEEVAVLEEAALHVNLGESSKGGAAKTRMGAVAVLRQALDGGGGAVGRALAGELPVIVRAHRRDDILVALSLAEEYGFRMILSGGADAPLVADALAAQGVPVLVQPDLQPSGMETAGVRYDNAALLHRAGVRIAFASDETTLSRQLVPNVGLTVGYGLPEEAALEALTIGAARIFGVDDRLGSLEVGKEATLFLSRGDPLQVRSPVVDVWVRGRRLAPRSYQTRLCEEFVKPLEEGIPCLPE